MSETEKIALVMLGFFGGSTFISLILIGTTLGRIAASLDRIAEALWRRETRESRR